MLNTINSATQGSVMLAPRAMECCHLVCRVSSTPEACGAAVAVRSGRSRVRAQGSKVRLADKPDLWVMEPKVGDWSDDAIVL